MRLNAVMFGIGMVQNAPDLLTGTASASGGDLCFGGGNWIVIVFWTTDNPNDAAYQIDLHRSVDGGAYASWLTGLTTDDSNQSDDTGHLHNLDPPHTEFATRRYKVRLIRKSDSALMEEIETDLQTLNYQLGACV